MAGEEEASAQVYSTPATDGDGKSFERKEGRVRSVSKNNLLRVADRAPGQLT